MNMQVETVLPDGRTTTKPILPGLNSTTRSFTFSEPRGLLFSTQFAQCAILVQQKASFEDLRAKGFIQSGATYAGHSLGEYGSLSAFSGFLSMNDLMDVVFYRGLSMQLAMDREEDGGTGYSMVAANPKRVGKGKDLLPLSHSFPWFSQANRFQRNSLKFCCWHYLSYQQRTAGNSQLQCGRRAIRLCWNGEFGQHHAEFTVLLGFILQFH